MQFCVFTVLRIRAFWPLDPGWVNHQDPDPGYGSGMKSRIIFPKAWKQFFQLKMLNFLDADQDPGSGHPQIRNTGVWILKFKVCQWNVFRSY
jgi:hypothetical protein